MCGSQTVASFWYIKLQFITLHKKERKLNAILQNNNVLKKQQAEALQPQAPETVFIRIPLHMQRCARLVWHPCFCFTPSLLSYVEEEEDHETPLLLQQRSL